MIANFEMIDRKFSKSLEKANQAHNHQNFGHPHGQEVFGLGRRGRHLLVVLFYDFLPNG